MFRRSINRYLINLKLYQPMPPTIQKFKKLSTIVYIFWFLFTSTNVLVACGLLTHSSTASQHSYHCLLQYYWVCASYSSPSMKSHWYTHLANWSYVPLMFVVVASLMELYLDTLLFRYPNRAIGARRDLQAKYLLFHCVDVDVWLMFWFWNC